MGGEHCWRGVRRDFERELRLVAHNEVCLKSQRSAAERSEWRACWLKELESELKEEKLEARTKIDMADRLLIARLSLDTAAMAQSDDPDILTVLAGMPSEETSLEYLMGCWKRLSGANKAFRRLVSHIRQIEADSRLTPRSRNGQQRTRS